MDIPTIPDVLQSIERFCARHEMTPTRFGALCTGDQNLVAALTRGSQPRLDRLHRIADFMRDRDREAGFEHADVDSPSVDASSPGNGDDLTAKVAA